MNDAVTMQGSCASDGDIFDLLRQYASYYLVMDQGQSVVISNDGEYEILTQKVTMPLFCINAPLMVRNAGYSLTQRRDGLWDIAELAIFFHPNSGVMPTLKDLLAYFNCPEVTLDLYGLVRIYDVLIIKILQSFYDFPADRQKLCVQKLIIAQQTKWCWADLCLEFLGIFPDDKNIRLAYQGVLASWDHLSPNEAKNQTHYEDNKPITSSEAFEQLEIALGTQSTARPNQRQYIEDICQIFQDDLSAPEARQKIILSEAGTGTGKTLGYLAPAIAWAIKNKRPAVISTYSKALQNQVAAELGKFFPDPVQYDQSVMMRKGRENYLCLRQYQRAILAPNIRDEVILYLSFIAGWIETSHYGDLSDIYFPLWINDLFPNVALPKLTVSAQECTYAQCPFYQKCFAEKSAIASDKTKIIITNHAFLMSKFQNNPVTSEFSGALIIDEAHQIFAAADNIYNVAFNLYQLGEFKHFILGSNSSSNMQSGSLMNKYDETINLILLPEIKTVLYEKNLDLLSLFDDLPERTQRGEPSNLPDFFGHNSTIYHGFFEQLQQIFWQHFPDDQEMSIEDLLALQNNAQNPVSICALFEAPYEHLEVIKGKIKEITGLCQEYLNQEHDTETMRRLTYYRDFLNMRILPNITDYLSIITPLYHGRLLEDMSQDYVIYGTQDLYKKEGLVQISLLKRYLNPTEQFGYQILSYMQRVVLTSAGLRANQQDAHTGWEFAAKILGLHYMLEETPLVSYIASDFDYEKQAKIIIVNDIPNHHTDHFMQAFMHMALASKGGVLGLFTAISRLKQAYRQMVPIFREKNLLTLAMHQAIANNQTLIQLFKQDQNAILLGTDLMRDGIDIPGKALRLVIFERVPWHRTELIYKRRCALFKQDQYDKFMVKQKLKQAFGRLIRTKTDRGCFVLFASRCPSSLFEAFPNGSVIEKYSTQDAIEVIKAFNDDEFS